jgi:hypothetical protein
MALTGARLFRSPGPNGAGAPSEIGCLSVHHIRIDAVNGENRQYRRPGSGITAASRNEESVEKP